MDAAASVDCKSIFGKLEIDVVVFEPENVSKDGFEAERLCDAIKSARSDDQLSYDAKSNLNHLIITIRNPASSASTYTVTDLTAVSLILSNLQQRLSAQHHIVMVDLGCKSRSCSAGGAQIKTRQSHSSLHDDDMSGPNAGLDWHDSFKAILDNQLDLEAVERCASFILADFGIEFSADGRFMHWEHQACKRFRTAMGGKGSLFFSFGVRQLANFDSWNTEFERFDPFNFSADGLQFSQQK